MEFTDQQVVAAVNSCLDLTKYNKLPGYVKDRFACLLKKHRIGSVCFMGVTGFGLRVYGDDPAAESRSGDELIGDHGVKSLNLDGYWLRCPGEMWQPPDFHRVMREDGRYFFQRFRTTDDATDDEEPENTPRWCGRSSSERFPSRAAAEEVAAKIPGAIVVKD